MSASGTFDFGTGGTGNNNNDVAYDYNNTNFTFDKTSYSAWPPSFDEDAAQLS